MISALYIVKRDGRLIYHYEPERSDDFNTGITEATLFSGIISAIQSVMKEINAGEISNFNTEKHKIYLKSRHGLVYVILMPLETVYTDQQMNEFYLLLNENLPAKFNSQDFSITKEENKMMNTIVKMIYNQWADKLSESKASKTLKEDLW